MTDELLPEATAEPDRLAVLEEAVAKLGKELDTFGMRLSRALLRLDEVEREKMDAPNASIAWVELDQRLSTAIADVDRKAQSALDLHCETHNASRAQADVQTSKAKR